MRKLISVLLVCLLSICVAAPVYADGETATIDLEAMSLEELLELHTRLDAEIDARIGCDQSTICDGLYVAGKSIKPGTYMITCTEVYNNWMYVTLFGNEEDYTTYSADMYNNVKLRLAQESVDAAGKSVIVHLEDGMVMDIVGGKGTIEPVASDWVS